MKIPIKFFAVFALIALTISLINCKQKTEEDKEPEILTQYDEPESVLPINRLNLPEGFKIEVYADSIDGARSMAMGENGTLFVGTRNDKTVYAIQDLDKDYRADHTMILDSTLEVPNGIA
ncbi:MAG: sorbosone dehydrogenase family protein, partial [Maribacter sp.]